MTKIKQNLTNQNIEDIETAIMNKVVRIKKEPAEVIVNYKGVDDYATVATISWNIDGVLHTKTGVSRKQKGDQYNKKAGQILALIDMI